MGYFIHNKYDAESLSQVSGMETAGHTVIDYYGLLENEDYIYRYIDTSQMPGLVNNLEYTTINPSQFLSNTLTPDSSSQFKFESSIVIKSVQSGIVTGITKDTAKEIIISPVVPNKCSVRLGYGYTTSTGVAFAVGATLTQNTLILQTFVRGTANPGEIYCRYEIVEYK